jgi:Rrf2 family protein
MAQSNGFVDTQYGLYDWNGRKLARLEPIQLWEASMKLQPSRRTDYGIRALVFLANEAPEMRTATEIADAMEIPQSFLYQVLQILSRARLVKSQLGRGGGYTLMPLADEVSILKIVETLEGPFDTGECALRGGPCHWAEVCALHWVWTSAREALIDSLGKFTLKQVATADRSLQEGRKEIPADSHRR